MAELRFESTRGGAPLVSLSQAIVQGLATDGGLYIPTKMPQLNTDAFETQAPLPMLARAGLAEGNTPAVATAKAVSSASARAAGAVARVLIDVPSLIMPIFAPDI